MVKLLSEKQKPSEKTDLGVSIFVYTNAGQPMAIWANSMVGVSEYTTNGEWKQVTPTDPRVLELQDYSMYKIDWANTKDFDEEGESRTLELYKSGQLTEDYLKENATFLRGPVVDES